MGSVTCPIDTIGIANGLITMRTHPSFHTLTEIVKNTFSFLASTITNGDVACGTGPSRLASAHMRIVQRAARPMETHTTRGNITPVSDPPLFAGANVGVDTVSIETISTLGYRALFSRPTRLASAPMGRVARSVGAHAT